MGELGLMCFHAHPDDEVIATGGVLSRYADEGIRTAVVTATGGELGEIVGPDMDPEQIRPRLAEVRRTELVAALAVLGADGPRFLGYRDSGMMGTDGNDDPRSFWRAPLDEAIGRLVAQIRDFRPSVFVTYDAFGGYGHPDHVQTHRVGLLAAEASGDGRLYPEAGPPWRVPKVYQSTLPRSLFVRMAEVLAERGLPPPSEPDEPAMGVDDELITTTVDVSVQLERKFTALRAHVSQVAPDSFFYALPDDLRLQAFGREWFVRQRSDVAVPADGEDDLFAGLR